MTPVNTLESELDDLVSNGYVIHKMVRNSKDAYDKLADRADKLRREKQERERKERLNRKKTIVGEKQKQLVFT